MSENPKFDYALERRLFELSPDLHRRFTDAVVALQHILSGYQRLFPDFTDHTELHSLSVVAFCNQLIGNQISLLNADEIYVLLTACYFHDTGMGITEKDYAEFIQRIDFGDYFETHRRDDIPQIVRDFHHEFSGLFVRKYADFFEIPSDVHLNAIVQIVRGHRATNLMDSKEYPVSLEVPGGNRICLPYLAALIRLADEIDVAAARNPALLYDMETLSNERDILEFRRHNAIHAVGMSRDSFTLLADRPNQVIVKHILRLTEKMQDTLDYCRKVVNKRTRFHIEQKKIHIRRNS
ncbi:MAG: hypothetical protein IJ121_12560 [Eubacterium sp.]|nr:hypothetical protein [Eubacterium sp.]